MLQTIYCECGESHMTRDGLCVKCGKDREVGRGKELVKYFMDSFKVLRDDQKREAIRDMAKFILKFNQD